MGMDLYSIALFVHIVGALLLFALLSVEGIGLRVGFPTAQINRVLGPIAALAIFVPGLYMMKAQWGFAAWVVVGITTYVLIAAAGAYTGISLMRGRMDGPAATLSWLLRIGMALGVVFDMTVKPDLLVSVAAVLVGAVAGAALGVVAQRRVITA
jgi:hypothetical protein